jgi:hypothetical protein
MRLRRLLLLLGPLLQIATAFLQRPACVQQERPASASRGFEKRTCSGDIAIVAQGRLAGRLYSNTVAMALPHHGGLTPAALVPASHGRRTLRGFRGTALGSPDHGGLTPAALVNLRWCTAQIVFWPANVRTATRAGGVSPPWDALGMRTRNVETQRVAVANAVSDQRRANAGRRTEPSAIATALPNPRRADARRSWLSARSPPNNATALSAHRTYHTPRQRPELR